MRTNLAKTDAPEDFTCARCGQVGKVLGNRAVYLWYGELYHPPCKTAQQSADFNMAKNAPHQLPHGKLADWQRLKDRQ